MSRFLKARTSILVVFLGLVIGGSGFFLLQANFGSFYNKDTPISAVISSRHTTHQSDYQSNVFATGDSPRTYGTLPEISGANLETALRSLAQNPATRPVITRVQSLYDRSAQRLLMHETDGSQFPMLTREGRIVIDALTGAFGPITLKGVPHAAWLRQLAAFASGHESTHLGNLTPPTPPDADTPLEAKSLPILTHNLCAASQSPNPASGGLSDSATYTSLCIDRSDIVAEIRKDRELAIALLDVELSAALLLLGEQESSRIRWIQAAEMLWTGPSGTARMIEAVLPANEEWISLRNGFERLRGIQHRGGFVPIDPQWVGFKIGTKHAGVELLRTRLDSEGYSVKTSSEAATPQWFDNEVTRALKEWQQDHSLDPTGILDTETVAALNVSVDHRIAQVRHAMLRYQSSGVTLHAAMIRVLIPGFALKLYESGVVRSQHRVIVGKATRSGPGGMTPEMTGSVHTITAHPSWTPTQSFIDEILIPAERKRPGEAKRRNLVHVRRGDGTMALTQPPGPKNPLGRLVLRFQDKGYYYLHDTPDQHVFKKNRRDASSGCVRVENIDSLAIAVARLGGVPNHTVESALTRDRQTQHISVPDPVPVSVEYVTVDVGENGRLRYFPDVYRLEESLLRDSFSTTDEHVEAKNSHVIHQETAAR